MHADQANGNNSDAQEYLEKSEKLINEDRYEVNSPITIEILNLSVTWVSHQTQRCY